MPAPLPAEVRIVPRRGTARPRWLLGILGALALVLVVANVPGLSLGLGQDTAPAARHVTARPAPPPPVHVTVGRTAYSCAVVPALGGKARPRP
jgi:hypothetical protein